MIELMLDKLLLAVFGYDKVCEKKNRISDAKILDCTGFELYRF